MKSRDVLDRNLAQLLRKAYRPVLPRESFREQLERDFKARAGRLAGGSTDRVPSPGTAVRGPRPLPWRRFAALAAALVALLFAGAWWRAQGQVAGGDLHGVLSSGRVALREDPGASWRASAEPDVEFQGSYLELVTPGQRGASVRAGSDRLELEAASRAVLRGPRALGVLEAVDFEQGDLLVERLGSAGGDEPLSVQTGEGNLLVDAGRARLTYADDALGRGLRVRVESGRTRVPSAATSLAAGAEALLRGGLIVESPADRLAAVGDGPGAGRQSVRSGTPELGPGEDAGQPGESAAPVAGVQLAGSVSLPALPKGSGEARGDPRPAEEFSIVLLRQVALPQVSEPEVFRFDAAAGRFELGGLEPGTYAVFARAPGHGPWRGGPVDLVAAAAAPVELEIEMSPGARLQGLVVDDETGVPVAGAVIVSETDAPVQILSVGADGFLDRPDILPLALSGSDGGFTLVDLSPGEHVVRGWAPGYAPTWLGPMSVAGGAPIELSLSRGGRLEGLVTDPAGAPLEGSLLIVSMTDFGAAHPVMSYAEAVTDASGRFAFEDLPAGFWPLLSMGVVTDESADLTPDLAFVTIEVGEVTRHDFAAEGAGVRLAGVLTGSDGSPAAGRAMWLTPAGFEGRDMTSTTTDGEGRFSFEGLRATTYAMFTSRGSPPDMMMIERVDLRSGADLLAHEVRLPGGGLAGRVLDGVDDAPHEFAVVILLQRDGDDVDFAGKTFTDASGRFSFDFAPAGTYELQVVSTRPAYGQESAAGIVLAEDLRPDLGDIYLYPGGGIELRATTPSGEPAAGVSVTLRFEDGLVYYLNDEPSTDGRGVLRIPSLKAGRWQIELSGAGFAPRVLSVDVPRAEQPAVVPVELRKL